MMLILILYIAIVNYVNTLNTVRVLFVNEEENEVAESAINVANNYFSRNPQLGVQLEMQKVIAYKNDSSNLLESLCSTYTSMLSEGKPPHLVFDTTRVGYVSETVKYWTAALGLATVSAAFGEKGDVRQWRFLSDQQQMYLLQIRPPTDLIADIIRPMVIHQKIPNAAIFHDDSYVLQHKYKTLLLNFATRHVISVVDPPNIRQQLHNSRELDIGNFFILGNYTTTNVVLEGACQEGLLTNRYSWHVIMPSRLGVQFQCARARILLVSPRLGDKDQERMEVLKKEYELTARPELMATFYFDLMMHAVVAVKNMQVKNVWPSNMLYITCEEFNGNNTPSRSGLNLKKHFDNDIPFHPIYGAFVIDKNGQSGLQFSMDIQGVQIIDGVVKSTVNLATWDTGNENNFTIINPKLMKSYISDKFFRVVTVEQKPFIYIDKSSPRGFKGFCIDLLDEIARLCNFDYDIRLADDGTWGSIDASGNWSGVVRELLDLRTDIGLGAMSVMAEREAVVDFSMPFYDMVGIGILMKQPPTSKSLFRFLTVLENEVWFCLLIAYFFTSLLMWIFDRLSPFSFQNNVLLYQNSFETRLFNFRECLWFCITSLTPQGGGEAPKNPSGRLVAATWWLFGFIVIASYTANLAAFLTVSRLDGGIESLDDLAKQYKVEYAPINGSSAMVYFKRMAQIENNFYEIWLNMSLNTPQPSLSVWEYPLSDKYTKLWAAMQRTGLPADVDEALARVRSMEDNDSEGFAYLGDATDLKYLKLTNCDLKMAGEEFSKKPYAIAIQKGHPLKEQVDNAILTMVNRRYLTYLKDKWWTDNPDAAVCEANEATGISIQNIAGVFIVVLVGTICAVLALLIGYWRSKCTNKPKRKKMSRQTIAFMK